MPFILYSSAGSLTENLLLRDLAGVTLQMDYVPAYVFDTVEDVWEKDDRDGVVVEVEVTGAGRLKNTLRCRMTGRWWPVGASIDESRVYSHCDTKIGE